MAAAPVKSCQFVALNSPWGHLGSVVDVRNRLHRIRRRFQHISAKLGSCLVKFFFRPPSARTIMSRPEHIPPMLNPRPNFSDLRRTELLGPAAKELRAAAEEAEERASTRRRLERPA